MPSMKLKLFISATIQSIVTGYCSAPRSSGCSSGSVRWSIVAPAATGMAAADELARELRERVDLEAVVEQADGRAHAGAEQDRVRAPAERRLQQQHRHRHGHEHRDAAAERDRPGVQAPVGAAAVDEPDVRGDPRRERRQPERKHARQAERDQGVEARLRHGRAFRVTTRSASSAEPERANADDERAAPRRRQRELHALARRAGVRRLRDDAAVAEDRRDHARGIVGAHAHDDAVQAPRDPHRDEARAGVRLDRRRRGGGRRRTRSRRCRARPRCARSRRSRRRARRWDRRGRSAACSPRSARRSRRGAGCRSRRSRCRPGPRRRRCARCGCGRTCRAGARPCC